MTDLTFIHFRAKGERGGGKGSASHFSQKGEGQEAMKNSPASHHVIVREVEKGDVSSLIRERKKKKN